MLKDEIETVKEALEEGYESFELAKSKVKVKELEIAYTQGYLKALEDMEEKGYARYPLKPKQSRLSELCLTDITPAGWNRVANRTLINDPYVVEDETCRLIEMGDIETILVEAGYADISRSALIWLIKLRGYKLSNNAIGSMTNEELRKKLGGK